MAWTLQDNSRKLRRGASWLAALAGLVAAGGFARAMVDDISPDQLPEGARRALEELSRGARLEELERDDEDGVRLYEAEWRDGRYEFEATVMGDGTLLELKEELPPERTPPAVLDAAARQFGPDARLRFERKTYVVYEVDGDVDGRRVGVYISVSGRRHHTRVRVEGDIPREHRIGREPGERRDREHRDDDDDRGDREDRDRRPDDRPGDDRDD